MKLQKADFTFVMIQCGLFFLYIFDIPQWQCTLPKLIVLTGIPVTILGLAIILIAILQLNKNLSPFPTPKSGSQLIQNGLYKYIRHPIYTGILLLFLGYSIYATSGYKLLITFLAFVLFAYKSRYEEKRLTLVFEEYAAYKKRTGRFFPKFNL